MRRLLVAGALAMLLAATTVNALPGPTVTAFTPRSAIVIASDADFTAANGVVAGTGTPDDPFVISGWHFLAPTGITIRNTTKSYLIADNLFESSVGVRVESGDRTSVIANNQFNVRVTGVAVYDASVVVQNNSFIGYMASGGVRTGVQLYGSNAHVDGNAFVWIQEAIKAQLGSPVITCNDIHDDVVVFGVSLLYTTNATVACNIITQCDMGIIVTTTIGTVVANNTIDGCGGVKVVLSKDVLVENNTVRGSATVGIWLDTTSGVVRENLVIDGRADGIGTRLSTVLIADNEVTANLGAGIRVGLSPTTVEGNVVSRNAVGIAVAAGSVPHLRANVATNNTVGIDLSYSSRQAVVHMQGNLVNGVNVDGSLDASQRVYFYKAANVTIAGQVRDSGFSAGYYGSLTAQGNVVLWEVDTATITGSVIGHSALGVGVVNSFNVVVSQSQIVQAGVGVDATSWPVPGEDVPNCVVSVKDTNITIPVDPPATVGVRLQGCLGLVLDTAISLVDIGVVVGGTASIQMLNSTVAQTRVGLDIQGAPDGVNVTGNAILGNAFGARIHGTSGVLAENRFEGNAKYAARLSGGANLRLERNVVRLNGEGVVDAQPCGGAWTCSSVAAKGNLFLENRGDGLRVNGTSSLRGDVAAGNGGAGFRLGSASVRGVNASGNLGDGALVSGTFSVEASRFEANEGHGLRAIGQGRVEDSRFVDNDGAGIRASVASLTITRANVSRNLDGILADELVAPTPTSVGVSGVASLLGSPSTPEPIRIHRSVLLGNERDAIRSATSAVNATHNWWGRASGPSVSVLDTLGAFQNGVSPTVRFAPFWADEAMTTTGPVAGV